MLLEVIYLTKVLVINSHIFMKHASNTLQMNNFGYKPLHFHCETFLVHTMRIYIWEIRFENQVNNNQTYIYQNYVNISSVTVWNLE